MGKTELEQQITSLFTSSERVEQIRWFVYYQLQKIDDFGSYGGFTSSFVKNKAVNILKNYKDNAHQKMLAKSIISILYAHDKSEQEEWVESIQNDTYDPDTRQKTSKYREFKEGDYKLITTIHNEKTQPTGTKGLELAIIIFDIEVNEEILSKTSNKFLSPPRTTWLSKIFISLIAISIVLVIWVVGSEITEKRNFEKEKHPDPTLSMDAGSFFSESFEIKPVSGEKGLKLTIDTSIDILEGGLHGLNYLKLDFRLENFSDTAHYYIDAVAVQIEGKSTTTTTHSTPKQPTPEVVDFLLNPEKQIYTISIYDSTKGTGRIDPLHNKYFNVTIGGQEECQGYVFSLRVVIETHDKNGTNNFTNSETFVLGFM
ncbi:hypothetical protein [Reichenbachiella sp.]|uniref:hypothetical protein n=1 Tax=Reichenbachiella sp. TaxID=2184521 RepID=UPI0032992975